MAQFKVPDRSLLVRWRGTLDGLLPVDHLARFVWDVLCAIDFSELEAQYPATRGGPGRPPYHPRLLAALWVYGMTAGFETAAGIAFACTVREDFQWLSGGLCPCDQTLLNFLTRAQDKITSVWVQVLEQMHEAGLIDLSVLVEDGTKLQANASPRSFRTLDSITQIVAELHTRVEARLRALAEGTGEDNDKKALVELNGLKARLSRAEAAEARLKSRDDGGRKPKQASKDVSPGRDMAKQPSEEDASPGRTPGKGGRRTERFGGHDFEHDVQRDVLLCPGRRELRFIGEYDGDGAASYRLYGARADCTDCPLRDQCTQAKRRRVKRPVRIEVPAKPAAGLSERSEAAGDNPEAAATDEPPSTGRKGRAHKGELGQPQASVSDPDATWMLATSKKRWEPSYNADITVTRNGIIVSQFLTMDSTDFHHFTPALAFVQDTLGQPESWVGDGHYGTEANLLLAHEKGVLLYAPRAGGTAKPTPSQADGRATSTVLRRRAAARFGRAEFQRDVERDVLVCPADEDLRFMGEYPAKLREYRLYGRRSCGDCELKSKCTASAGRRVRLPFRARAPPSRPLRKAPDEEEVDPKLIAEVLAAHQKRMDENGKPNLKLRCHTSESANAHLKAHGLGRFHVRRLARCATVLTLGCIAHNLMKWRARAATLSMKLAS